MKKFKSIYKNGKKNIIKSGDIEIKKQKSHQYEKPISIKKYRYYKIVVSNKVSFDKKSLKIYGL